MIWLHPILVLYIFLLSVSFFVGLAISIVSLYAAWAMGPKLKKNNALCCLMIALATSLWVVMLSQLFDPMFEAGPNGLDWFVYAALVGVSPVAAFPGIYLCGGKKKKST